ncbi:MAG: cytochrome b N-terminal domain-containing protein, partial [Chitinivibrionia bacterium]|nr:cytochrome b N-terminal domain-containing protein [Chitinivibrionia bacterium]
MKQTGTSKNGFFARVLPVEWQALRKTANEEMPAHMGTWWWCLGGTPLLLFMIQVATGLLLLMYYVPGTNEAYESVGHITNTAPFGWFIRSLHKWSANFMIFALFLHLLRVFFTGAYRSPRQLNWCVGVLLLATTLAFGFTGYSLVYEQMSYWGSTVAMNLVEATPLVGPTLAYIVRGGTEIGQGTLSRLYIMHIIILPLAALILIWFHILLTRLHGVTELHFQDKPAADLIRQELPELRRRLDDHGIELAAGVQARPNLTVDEFT